MTIDAITQKNKGGFDYSIPPLHSVFANFYVKGKKLRCRDREVWNVEPQHIGFVDMHGSNYTHFIPPHSVICITEGQEFFDSRRYKDFKPTQSRFFERHRHIGYDIFIDVQRYDLIDKNIRELAEIIEIQGKRDIRDKFGKISHQVWTVRKFATCQGYDNYRQSGKVLKNYKQETIKSNCNVHRLYNSQGCEPDFYFGHLHSDFDLDVKMPPAQTFEGYAKYFNKYGGVENG